MDNDSKANQSAVPAGDSAAGPGDAAPTERVRAAAAALAAAVDRVRDCEQLERELATDDYQRSIDGCYLRAALLHEQQRLGWVMCSNL